MDKTVVIFILPSALIARLSYLTYIYNRKSNTFIIVDKNLEKVKDIKSHVTCESTIGNMFVDLK